MDPYEPHDSEKETDGDKSKRSNGLDLVSRGSEGITKALSTDSIWTFRLNGTP